jgi:basic membrane lipoprotein Med (substrate-binding protein (PBP1-ABC) superfamily)
LAIRFTMKEEEMYRSLSRRLAAVAMLTCLLAVFGVLTGAAGATPRSANASFKVALIAPSAHNDLAFTQSMYGALKTLQAKYHFTLSVSENQFVVADAANVMRQYASEGYNLIIAHGSQYGGTVQQLAPSFPKVSFAWGTASATFGLKNVYAYSAASNQGGYVQGFMASLMSKSHVVGEIGPIATGDAKLYIDGFKAGALAGNPDSSVQVSYTGSFSDASLMSKQASVYLAQKADVLTGSSQSVVGAITVAKAKNIPWFGTQWVQSSLAPKQVVSSQVYDWTGMLTRIVDGVKAGKLGGSSFAITLKNGGEKIVLNPGFKLAAAVKAAELKVIKSITSGAIKVPA